MEITTEIQAANILQQLVNNDLDIKDPKEIFVSDWADLKIHIPGESYVIPTTVMRGIIALQQSVFRGSAVILDGKPNITYLSAREKEMLTLNAFISEGSTDVKVDINEIIGNLVGPLVGKLSANQIMTLVLSGALLWGGNAFYRTYATDNLQHAELEMQDAQNQRLIAHLESHSAHDKTVIDALMSANKETARSAQLYSVQRQSAPDIIKGLKDAKASTLGEMPLTPSTVDAITRNPRQETIEQIINGKFKIENVNTKSPLGFRIRLENTENGDMFTAGLEDAVISSKTRAVIETATYKKTPIDATVTAKIKGGKIIDATINSADHSKRPQ